MQQQQTDGTTRPEICHTVTLRRVVLFAGVPPKLPVTLRLDSDVVRHFRATGKGWQTRINDILRKAAGL